MAFCHVACWSHTLLLLLLDTVWKPEDKNKTNCYSIDSCVLRCIRGRNENYRSVKSLKKDMTNFMGRSPFYKPVVAVSQWLSTFCDVQMPFTALTPSLSFAVSIHEVSCMCALFLSLLPATVLCTYVITCQGCVAYPILHLITPTIFGERCDLIDNKILVILVWKVLHCCLFW